MEDRLGDLESQTRLLQESMDSLSGGTRERLDSVKSWLAGRAAQMATDQAERSVEMAREAWRDAKAKLPEDLTKYEREIALKELKQTVRSWFDLSDEEWKSIMDEK